MSQTSSAKWAIRSICGGLGCLSLVDQLLSYTTYESCTHQTITAFNVTLLFWWIKLENYDKGALPLIVAMIEAIFLRVIFDDLELEGCKNHRFESSIPQFYHAILLINFWLDGILWLILPGFRTVYLVYQRAKKMRTRDNSRVANKFGLSEKQKKKWYPHVYTKTMREENEDCPVCLLEMKEGEEVIDTPKCRHKFHAICLDDWVSKHATCPYCREPVGNSKIVLFVGVVLGKFCIEECPGIIIFLILGMWIEFLFYFVHIFQQEKQ